MPASRALAQGTPGALTQLAPPNDCYQQQITQGTPECGSGSATGTGLNGTESVAVSPDGGNVYVVSPNDNAVAEFSRAGDGSLTEIGCIASTTPIDSSPVSSCTNRVATGLRNPVAIAISPDGANVYVAARDNHGVGTIAELARNPSDGTLTQPSPNDCIAENLTTSDTRSDCLNQSGFGMEGPTSLAVSPDGTNLYVADGTTHAVAEFTRNASGTLAQLNGPDDCIEDQSSSSTDCATKVPGIGDGGGSPSGNESGSPSWVAVSPDGSSVYTAGFDSSERGLIAEFSRGGNGALTQTGCVQSPNSGAGCTQTALGMSGFVGLVISPDGRNLYTASMGFGGPIAEFARADNGSLSQLPAPNNCIEEGVNFGCGSPPDSNTGTGIDSGYQLAMSPDGASLYAAAPNCGNSNCSDVAEFSRNASTGALTQLQRPNNCIQELSQANSDSPECGNGSTTGVGTGLGGYGVAVSPDNNSVYVTGPTDVAEFARTPVQFTLSVSRSGSGTGSVTDDQGGISCPPTCSHPYNADTFVTLTAHPAPGSQFTGWSGSGCAGTGPCTVFMSADMNVNATFDTIPPATHTLTVSKAGSGGGTVTDDKGGISCPPTCSHAYASGTQVTLTANPASGSSFAGWSGGGCSGTGTCTVTMNADTSVTATFNALPAAGGPGSPSIISNIPIVHGSNGAGYSGTANPEGSPTFVFWQYGLDKRYTKAGGKGPHYTNATSVRPVGSDSSPHPVSASVGGLLPNALYHVRMVAFNGNGTAFGPDRTFVTGNGPAPGPPRLGKSFDIAPVSGIVFIVIGHRLIPLTAHTQVPAGTIIDALHGSLRITTASGHGTVYQGVFGGAVFQLTEITDGPDKGLTTLTLVEGTFKGAPTYRTCTARGARDRTATASAHTALSSRILQTLRARASGRFRTRGRYAAGTIRGTQWSTSDRCDGTLIAVQVHSVLVDDFVKQGLILVPQGHSYLAGPHTPPPPEVWEVTEPLNEGGE